MAYFGLMFLAGEGDVPVCQPVQLSEEHLFRELHFSDVIVEKSKAITINE